jgi:hypothetical protein
MSPLAHYIISTYPLRRRSSDSLSSTTSSMNSDIGLQATTADIGTPKASSVDLKILRNKAGDKAFGKGHEQSHRSNGQGDQREQIGGEAKKDSGEGFWRFLAGV